MTKVVPRPLFDPYAIAEVLMGFMCNTVQLCKMQQL
jgi:hypothetical protein